MREWTAKVDLTLMTNAQAAVTPSFMWTKLLDTVAIHNVGNIAQSATLGIGGGVDTTAVRTEILSFTVSLAELRTFKQQGYCNLPEGPRIYTATLGFKSGFTPPSLQWNPGSKE